MHWRKCAKIQSKQPSKKMELEKKQYEISSEKDNTRISPCKTKKIQKIKEEAS